MPAKHLNAAGNETLKSVASVGFLGLTVGGGRWHLPTLRITARTALEAGNHQARKQGQNRPLTALRRDVSGVNAPSGREF